MLRSVISTVLYWSGFFYISHWLNRYEIPILALHGVIDTEDNTGWLPLRSFLSKEQLDKHITFLTKYYNFISLDEAHDIISGRVPKRKYCMVITFDDGYLNNLNYAAPVLAKHDVPATFFPTIVYQNQQQPFWFDRLDYAVQHNIDESTTLVFDGDQFEIDTTDKQVFKESLVKLVGAILGKYTNDLDLTRDVEVFIKGIEERKGRSLLDIYQNDKCCLAMSASDINSLAADPLFTIGSHTYDHIRIGPLDDNEVLEQLQSSKQMLEELIGRSVNHFCYPCGSYNERTMQLVQECGFSTGMTSDDGTNVPGDNLFSLRRRSLSKDIPLAELLCITTGTLDIYEKLKKMIRQLGR